MTDSTTKEARLSLPFEGGNTVDRELGCSEQQLPYEKATAGGRAGCFRLLFKEQANDRPRLGIVVASFCCTLLRLNVLLASSSRPTLGRRSQAAVLPCVQPRSEYRALRLGQFIKHVTETCNYAPRTRHEAQMRLCDWSAARQLEEDLSN